MCALVALLNGAAWSIITPPFQGRDEPAHFAYVQQLAETGTLPHESVEHQGFSPEETRVLEGLHQEEIKLSPEIPAISSTAEQRTLDQDVNENLSALGSGEAGVATAEPPLYYALETVPYALGAGNILTQLELMRLTGALLAAITTLLVFFFLREILPRAPWACTIATACIAIQPLFGFMSGTLNPDNMLYTVSAAVFLCLARAFRRELSIRLAILTGVLIAAGFITKLNFIGLAAGVFLGLGLLGVREVRSRGRNAARAPAIAAGIGASPVALYLVVNSLSNHPALGSVVSDLSTLTNKGAFHEISYIWQLYLPRLPGMTHYFAGIGTFRDIWFDRFVGLYGWLDTEFPNWVDNLALIPAIAVAALCFKTLVVSRHALRERLGELVTYASMSIGVLVMVGVASYASHNANGVGAFDDPRYLLPMLPLLGAVLVLAARGAGRWASTTAAAILIIFFAHDIFSQLQVIARYYG
jgi:4-amino-4-deoxy-L-arabinose transferase-like glycosyltransferase